jgi:ribosomal protein L19E
VESHRATWASFSSRPRALQTKRRQQHGALRRSGRARHTVSVQDTLPRRHSSFGGAASLHATWASFQAAQGLFRPSAGNGMATTPQYASTTRRLAVHMCLDSTESHRATWASFSSRPRALQPKRWQQHGTPCRSKRAKHAAVSSTGVWIARFRFVRRGLAFQAAQGLFRPSAGNGMAPSLQYASKICRRAVHMCLDSTESHRATWASFSSRPRALQPKRWQQHGAPCRSKRTTHAAVPSTGVWIARFRFVRRGLAFQAAKGFFSSNAGNGMAPLAAVSVQDALTCRLQVCGERGVASCDLGQIFKRPRALHLRSYLDLEGRRLSSRSA